MKEYFDLGKYSRKVTTNELAQIWFNRGMVWLFAYNHEESILCFEKVIELDKNCAFAYWGIAYAIGPNYNKPWDIFTSDEKIPTLKKAHECISKANKISDLSILESEMLKALEQRYPKNPDIDDFQPFSDAFAIGMKKVFEIYPNDLDIICFYVESLMNRTPWKLWDFRKSLPNPESSTNEAMEILENIFNKNHNSWEHPGLLHLYIHLMEMSPNPEKALKHGDCLKDLVPDSGHLIHMATHIDVLCGDYQNVLYRNLKAIEADELYKSYAGTENFYALYRIHNLHFAFYGAMFLGQKQNAISLVKKIREEVNDKIVRLYPDIFETFIAAAPHVYVRFGMWEEILQIDQPKDTNLYVTTNALLYYAKAIALANLNRISEAKIFSSKFLKSYELVPDSRMLFNNKSRDVLAIAQEMMIGEIEFKAGNLKIGLSHLRKAVKLDDGLAYEEPWCWPQPTRHALGALLMAAGEFDEAETVFRADLGLDGKLPRPCQNPKNVWSLHGLHECLFIRKDTVELPHVELLLNQAKARTDIVINSSCFCRNKEN